MSLIIISVMVRPLDEWQQYAVNSLLKLQEMLEQPTVLDEINNLVREERNEEDKILVQMIATSIATVELIIKLTQAQRPGREDQYTIVKYASIQSMLIRSVRNIVSQDDLKSLCSQVGSAL